MAMLRYTGHPLADVGVATICAMVDKSDPGALTLEDLDTVAKEIAEYYFSGLMTSYLSCVFMNAQKDQPPLSLLI
jgi:CRISPR-associated protein Cst1